MSNGSAAEVAYGPQPPCLSWHFRSRAGSAAADRPPRGPRPLPAPAAPRPRRERSSPRLRRSQRSARAMASAWAFASALCSTPRARWVARAGPRVVGEPRLPSALTCQEPSLRCSAAMSRAASSSGLALLDHPRVDRFGQGRRRTGCAPAPGRSACRRRACRPTCRAASASASSRPGPCRGPCGRGGRPRTGRPRRRRCCDRRSTSPPPASAAPRARRSTARPSGVGGWPHTGRRAGGVPGGEGGFAWRGHCTARAGRKNIRRRASPRGARDPAPPPDGSVLETTPRRAG